MPHSLNRRQLLGSAAALAGVTVAGTTPAAEQTTAISRQSVRVAAVSYSPPFHDHLKDGVNLAPIRDMVAQVMRDKPNFICFPEICACVGGGFEKGIATAPDRASHVAEVAKIAREFNVALVVPYIERDGQHVYNSVPIVDSQGQLILNYRKNYPTDGELKSGIRPGHEVPVGVCDGVRVGAAVCFDANFDSVAMELERRRAQLVFWPSMYWGGRLLQHWASRYGFSVAVAYGAESAIIDLTGRYLDRRGNDTLKVRQKFMSPWAIAEIPIERDLFHLDYNQPKFPEIQAKYGPDIQIEVWEPEGYFVLTCHRPGLTVADVINEFKLETLRDYLARSVKLRNEKLA
jgi:predicted amidohydrolase